MSDFEQFVAIDFETANRSRASACAVGLALIDPNGEVARTYYTLLKPHPTVSYFDPGNIGIHGIYPEEVVGAPTWEEALPAILDFIGDLPLVAHNMDFDGSVMDALAEIYGQQVPNRRLCTLRVARALNPYEGSKRLTCVAQHYLLDYDFEHHHAEADAITCGLIFAEMRRQHGDETLAKIFAGNQGRRRYAGEDGQLQDTTGRIYLNVPYREKEAAKSLGARWDPTRKLWYVLAEKVAPPMGPGIEPFARWEPFEIQ
ncbi:hypothetical protein BSR28_07015 [Boudabousia liubingyangii]|uniref:DUF5710 domain-containing protein n=1 Tax=Boudabousia liubingyangii TaxID=1921764 RepID=UPI00093917A9|nr:DUF5710 domain-containing protein [Boudabousia liubingyangii]OKL46284.1 hypothetical protein BSR28_07015 [Boudabousia liubingyangii]